MVYDQKNLRIIFTDKAELVFSNILENYGLEESEEEFDDYISNDQESREMILRYAVEVVAKKIIPEEKLIKLLEKHLKISSESIKNIVRDIKNNLLPLLLVYPEEKFDDPIFREEISKKAFEEKFTKGEPILPTIKKLEITDVEENAEKIEIKGKRGPDNYREPVE